MSSIIGGAKGGGGTPRAAVIAPDSTRSTAIVEVVEAWGWGEIEGFPEGADPLEYVYLDGVPIKANGVENFKGVTFDCRLGTQDQTYIPGIVDDAVGSPEIVDVPVIHATPITRTITDPSTDAVRIILIFQALVVQDTTTGDRSGASVDLQIEVRPAGGAWTIIDLQGRDKVRDKTEAAYQRSYLINLRAVAESAGSYDIRVSRLSPDPGNGEQSAFNWGSYTKLTYAKLRRPNIPHCRITFDARYFSSIPVRSYLLRGWRIQVPTADVYDPIARTYTGADWSGTLVKSWCRNPAWFLYHLLTTAGAGLGDDINPAYQDKWAIYQIAKRCDELVPDGKGGTEPRYSIDAQFMAQTGAHEMIQQIAGIFDAQALWDGKSVYLTQDAPKPVSSLYLPANVVGGRFTYAGTGRQVRYTAALIQYNDPTDQYKLATEYVEDFYAIQRYGYRPKTETAVGCSSRSEAHRRGKRLLVTGREETDAVTFAVGLSGINDKPGDVVRIADPLRSTGQRLGGRIAADSTAVLINLDAPVTLANGVSYRMSVIGTDGKVWDSAVITAAGTHSAISINPAFPEAPEYELEWIIYDPLAIGQLYRILGVADNDDKSSGFYTVSATQYSAKKFAEIDDVADLGPLSDNPFAINGVKPPSGLQVSDGTYAAVEGLRRYIDISWVASPDQLLSGYVLSYAFNGQVKSQELTGLSFRIDNPVTGTYEISVVAVNLLGGQSAAISTTYELLKLYAVLDVSVINLGVKGAGLEFMGRNAEIHWETDADTVLNLPISYSNGKGGQSKWFRDFEVKIYTADGETLLRTDYTTEYSYSYTFEKNVEDGGPRRTFEVEVRARDEFGDYSHPGSIVPYNNPPQAGAVIESIPKEGSISFKITPPEDPDYKYLRLFGSKTQGFTPDATPGTGNLLYEGSETYISFPIDYAHNGNWYLRVQFVDEFGVDGAIYSAEGTQLVVATIADLEPGLASDILNVITDFNAGNNRNATAVAAPTIAADGTAIDHTLNPNGSIDISIEWSWTGNEATIDGFVLYAYSSTSSAPYVFNGLLPSELVFQLPASSRSYIHHGIPAHVSDGAGGLLPLYYTLGVVAYRKVDADIVTIPMSPNGVIHSAIVQPSLAQENPYCPASVKPASGDITTTIDGILAVNVNKWSWITGEGRPWDNADRTLDQISGSGQNILNSRYAVIDETDIPPYIITGGTVTLNNSATQFGLPAIRLTATSALAVLWLGANTTDYNFIITPGKKWLLSAYVRSGTANASGTLTVRGSDGNAYGFVEFLTSPTANTWTRVSGAINAAGNNSSLAMLRLENDAGSGTYIDFTGLMMEELIGNIIAPSAFVRPPISSIAGMPLDQVYSHVVDFTTSNNRDSSAIAAPTVATALDYSINTDGSANISLQWTWAGDEGSIDGFAVLAYSTNTNHGVYTFGTNPAKELVMQVPANRRAFIANGVAANAYYTVGVAAYRSVDKSVVASGVVTSSIAYANGPTERPFRPSVSVEYTGNVSGTVGGVVASTLVTNAATALAAVNDMSSDSLISPVEKGLIRKEWNAIASEKSIVESQATTYGITTEKTNYTNALQALGDYINGSAWTVGTVPLYINDANLGTSTPIDKTTFRLKFKDYYDARTTVIKKITDTANTNTNQAATTANWSGVASRPSNLTTLTGSETIKNSDVYLSGGAIQGIGTGSGTVVSNSLITLSASGTLNGAGGGTVTLAGMGAGTFATLNQLNASNIASYLAANSIGDTYLQSIAANKITAGSLAAGVIYSGTINASQINAGTLNAMTLTAASITGTSGINISGTANFSGSGSNAITGDNAAINASSSVHGIVGATYNGSAIAMKAYNSAGGIAFYCAGAMVTGSNAVVSNFNADMVDGVHATNLCSIVVGNNGTCNVSGTGFNLNTSTGLTSYEFYSAGNNVMLLRQISDKRLKTDIEPETLGLSFINRLQPVSFRKIANPAIKQHGFLADHLELIIGSVNEDALSIEHEEGTKGFDYIALIGPMAKAIQELSAELERLKNNVNNPEK